MRNELVIGRVRSSFGISGEVSVESLSGESAHFMSLRVVALRRGSQSESRRVESVRTTHRAVLIKFEGVDTPEDAAALRGAELVVDRINAAKLEPGEYYYGDLVGLVVTVEEKPVGRVTAIWESGAHPLVEVTPLVGKSALVPFVNKFIGEVDLTAGVIELRDAAILE